MLWIPWREVVSGHGRADDRYSRDLRAADDSGAFPKDPLLEFEEDPGTGNNPELPKDLRHDPPPMPAEILAALHRAKTPTIAARFLNGLTAKPSDADVRSLARWKARLGTP